MPTEHRITIRLPAHLYAELEGRSAQGTPMAALIRQAVEEYLARQSAPPTRAVQLAEDLARMLNELHGQMTALLAQVQALDHERPAPPASP